MAVIDLGRVRAVHKGEYSETTDYEFFDQVTHKGSSYLCNAKEGAPAGTLLTDNTKWVLLAQAGEKGDKGDAADIPVVDKSAIDNLF